MLFMNQLFNVTVERLQCTALQSSHILGFGNIRSKSKPELEFQYGGRFFETGNSYISAVD